MLRAGATVLCNSRHKSRLEALAEELGHPETLVTLHRSMMPEEAEATVAAAMELTAGRLDHVVAHSAVRYYPTCPTTWGAACPHPHPHPHPHPQVLLPDVPDHMGCTLRVRISSASKFYVRGAAIEALLSDCMPMSPAPPTHHSGLHANEPRPPPLMTGAR